jgi:hypothetical protein
MATRLTVTIPGVPASCLLPNKQRTLSHHVWGPEAASLRQLTSYAAWTGPSPVNIPHTYESVWLHCVIAWPKGRQRCDFQAAVHALKAPVDGLVDAGWMGDDKQLVGMGVIQTRSGDDIGSITITLEETT